MEMSVYNVLCILLLMTLQLGSRHLPVPDWRSVDRASKIDIARILSSAKESD